MVRHRELVVRLLTVLLLALPYAFLVYFSTGALMVYYAAQELEKGGFRPSSTLNTGSTALRAGLTTHPR
ncbi:MAG: hypothetical protein ABWK01_01655 [Infirmifilum sp.]